MDKEGMSHTGLQCISKIHMLSVTEDIHMFPWLRHKTSFVRTQLWSYFYVLGTYSAVWLLSQRNIFLWESWFLSRLNFPLHVEPKNKLNFFYVYFTLTYGLEFRGKETRIALRICCFISSDTCVSKLSWYRIVFSNLWSQDVPISCSEQTFFLQDLAKYEVKVIIKKVKISLLQTMEAHRVTRG
jgi:hypothetical protein